MAVFSYIATDSVRSETCGTIVADTPRQARDLLRERGLTIQMIDLRQPTATDRRWTSPVMRRYPRYALVSFIRELSTLLSVGIPLLDAIDDIAKHHKGNFKDSLLLLRDRVCAGVNLADAMAEQRQIFDELCIAITAVGEKSGTLDVVLERLAEFKERVGELRGRITTALMYPSIVLLTGLGVTTFLMTFVTPNLLSALVAAGKPLPTSTRLVKTVSDVLVHQWWLLLLVAIGLIAFGGMLLRTSAGRRFWHRAQLRIPFLGEMIRKQETLRIAVVMATLLRSGVPFISAVQIARQSAQNLLVREALSTFEDAVHAGRDLAPALAVTNIFPSLMVQIFAVGQQSGRLEEMLDRLASDYDRQLSLAAQRFTALLEPVLIVLLAVIVGFIAFATMMPILEAGNVL